MSDMKRMPLSSLWPQPNVTRRCGLLQQMRLLDTLNRLRLNAPRPSSLLGGHDDSDLGMGPKKVGAGVVATVKRGFLRNRPRLKDFLGAHSVVRIIPLPRASRRNGNPWGCGVRTALLALCSFSLVACSPQHAPETPLVIPAEPVDGGTLRVALQADGRSLDPHRVADAASMRLVENLYSTLLRYAEGYGEIEGDLAERWEIGDDGRTYTFHLRRDARFHRSGRPVTAADAAYSLRRIIDHEMRAQQFRHLESVEAPGAFTLVVRLSQPVAPFLTYLAHPMNAVVDREVVEANGGRLDRADAGSGPFQLVEWRKDRHFIMERHPAYHEAGRPRLGRVLLRPLPDETARSTALRNGEVDLVLDVPEKDRSLIERAPGVALQSVPGTFWEYVGMNCKRKPFDDVRVRQAVAWALDREALNRMVKFSRSVPLTGGVFPSNHWAYADLDLYPEPRPARARALLAEAGHPDGFSTRLRVGSAFPYQVAAAQIVKQQLRAVGIDVELVAEESSVFFDALGRGDFDMTLVGWLGFVDPDEWLHPIFHSGGAWNQQGYANARVDALLDAARRESDPDIRRGRYREAQELIFGEAPVALLYINEQTAARRAAVRDYRVHATATTLSLRDTWLAP